MGEYHSIFKVEPSCFPRQKFLNLPTLTEGFKFTRVLNISGLTREILSGLSIHVRFRHIILILKTGVILQVFEEAEFYSELSTFFS